MSDRAEGLTVIEGGKGSSGETLVKDPVAVEEQRAAQVVGSKPWATRVRRRAKDLSQTLDQGYMELARILYEVYDTPIDGNKQRGPIYTAWGYNSFAEYAEQELGLHQKKAERLRAIWFTLEVQLKDMPYELKERIVNLGMSKVRELVRVLTIRNAEMWIEQAENLTYRKLLGGITDELRRRGVSDAILGPGGEGSAEGTPDTTDESAIGALPVLNPVETLKQERFDLYPNQHENVMLALQRARDLTGSDKKGHLMDIICTDFIATNDVIGSDMDKRLRYVAKIERALGLKLVAIDVETKDVVYGIEALEIVAGS